MTGQGNLTFQNNTIPAPAPAGLQFADEGLGVEGGDTVVLGGDIAAGGYPVFSNDRVINTQGFSLKFYDAEPANIFMDLYPGFLQITNNVTGGGAVFNDTLFNIFDSTGQVSGGISGINGFFCDVYPGALSSPQVTLRNQRFAGASTSLYMQDDGTAVPRIDEYLLRDVLALGMRWGVDNAGGNSYFGWGFQSALNPVTNDFMYFDQADATSMGHIDQIFDGTKYALSVRNVIPASTRTMLISGANDQLDVQTTVAGGNARISYRDVAGTVRGYEEYNSAGNFIRHNATTSLRFNIGTQDRLFLYGGTSALNSRILVGGTASTASAWIQVIAQTAAAGSAPLKFNSSATLMTTPEDGAFEFDGTELYFTKGGTRRVVQMI